MVMTTTTMKAVRYHGPNVPLTLEEVPVPAASSAQEEGSSLALSANDVRVKVHAAALCHTELHFADGTLNLGVQPLTLGHEAVGVIDAVGASVDVTRVGERVIVYYYVGCGACRWCLDGEGNEQLCDALQAEYGFISDGGLAEYLVAPARNAVHLPETLTFVEAAPIGCGVTTAVHAAKLARFGKGDTSALVYGVNGVGFGLIQLLKNKYKIDKVIAVARSPTKRDKALELGADLAIDGTADLASVASQVREATAGRGVDVIFECVGHRDTLDACVGWTGALGKRGRLILIGYHAGTDHEFRYHPMPMIVYEQTVTGSVGATLEDLKEAVDLVATGQVKTVVDSILPLAQFQDGLDRIKSCECIGKIVCVPCSDS